MNYLNYIQGIFEDYIVSEEVNINYTGGTIFAIKYLGGGMNYQDSTIQPVQIIAHTDDIPTAMALMQGFAKDYSNVGFWESNEYIKQVYSTPLLLTFGQSGNNYDSQIIVNGTLIVSTNISDIKTVTIDGYEYETTERSLMYFTKEQSDADGTNNLNTTILNAGMLQFVCSMENKNNTICTDVRRIRQGTLDINTQFTIKLTFTDNDIEETYTMRLHSASFNSQNALSPVIALTFIQ